MKHSRFSFKNDLLGLIKARLAVVLVFPGAMAAFCPAKEPVSAPRLPADVRHSLEAIQGKEIIAHARTLCRPTLQGRQAATPGARKASAYLAGEFRRMGLRPGGTAGSHVQTFKIRLGYRVTGEMTVSLGDATILSAQYGADYRPVHLPGGRAEVDAPCILAGYGITAEKLKFDEYAGSDVKGKAVIVFTGAPWPANAAPWIRRILGDQKLDSLQYKARNAAAHGAVCLFVVDNPLGWRKSLDVAGRLALPDPDAPLDSPIPVAHIAPSALLQMTDMSMQELRFMARDIGREMESRTMLLRGRRLRLRASISGRAVIGRNIIGVLPGRDERLRKEAVVIGAHYDHLGEAGDGRIYFGANDNAAGVGAVLAVAQAVTALPRPPRRTMIFVAFDAEEIGRRGSKAYIAKPAIPIRDTVLMINFDMIGRNDPNHIYAVGTRSSAVVHRIHQEANRHVRLRLEHPMSFRLGLSDHSPFYFAKVPIMYLFGGRDADYNTPRDTWERLSPGKVEKVARLAFLTAVAAGERPDRPSFHEMPEGPD